MLRLHIQGTLCANTGRGMMDRTSLKGFDELKNQERKSVSDAGQTLFDMLTTSFSTFGSGHDQGFNFSSDFGTSPETETVKRPSNDDLVVEIELNALTIAPTAIAADNGPASREQTISDDDFPPQSPTAITIGPATETPLVFGPPSQFEVSTVQASDVVLASTAVIHVDVDDLIPPANEGGEIQLPDRVDITPLTGAAPEEETGSTAAEVSASPGVDASLTGSALTVDDGHPYPGGPPGEELPVTVVTIHYDDYGMFTDPGENDIQISCGVADRYHFGSGGIVIFRDFCDPIHNGNGSDTFVYEGPDDNHIITDFQISAGSLMDGDFII